MLSGRPFFWAADFLFRPGFSKSPVISLQRCQLNHFQSTQTFTANLWPRFPSPCPSSKLLLLQNSMNFSSLFLSSPLFNPFRILVSHANLTGADRQDGACLQEVKPAILFLQNCTLMMSGVIYWPAQPLRRNAFRHTHTCARKKHTHHERHTEGFCHQRCWNACKSWNAG